MLFYQFIVSRRLDPAASAEAQVMVRTDGDVEKSTDNAVDFLNELGWSVREVRHAQMADSIEEFSGDPRLLGLYQNADRDGIACSVGTGRKLASPQPRELRCGGWGAGPIRVGHYGNPSRAEPRRRGARRRTRSLLAACTAVACPAGRLLAEEAIAFAASRPGGLGRLGRQGVAERCPRVQDRPAVAPAGDEAGLAKGGQVVGGGGRA